MIVVMFVFTKPLAMILDLVCRSILLFLKSISIICINCVLNFIGVVLLCDSDSGKRTGDSV